MVLKGCSTTMLGSPTAMLSKQKVQGCCKSVKELEISLMVADNLPDPDHKAMLQLCMEMPLQSWERKVLSAS